MIVGSVLPTGEAVVGIRLRGQTGSVIAVEVVVDTGFTDWLTLPRETVTQLGLLFRHETRYVLADGTPVALREFIAEIEWFGQWRSVFVAETEGGPLLGMAMLRGCHLAMDVLDGGPVEIRALERGK